VVSAQPWRAGVAAAAEQIPVLAWVKKNINKLIKRNVFIIEI
jgi:hypothetical protein